MALRKGEAASPDCEDLSGLFRSRELPRAPEGWHAIGHDVLDEDAVCLICWDQPRSAINRYDPKVRTRLSRIAFDDEWESDVLEVDGWLGGWVGRWPDGTWFAQPVDGQGVVILEPDGSERTRFSVGSYYQRLACTEDGLLWVSYHDQALGEIPPSNCGLVAFDQTGECVWSKGPFGLGIVDCYAMTPAGRDVWICPYTDFPIVQVRSAEVHVWSNEVRGAHAMAVVGPHVLLAGGYGDEGSQLVLLELVDRPALSSGDTVLVARSELPKAFGDRTSMLGVNGTLHVLGNDAWHTLSIRDWVKQSRR